MSRKYNVLIMGASYGSLLGARLLLAGHDVRLVCLPAEAALIESEGFRVRLPAKGSNEQVEIDSRRLPGRVSASGADAADPQRHDLVALAMQEPQYASPGVRELLARTARAKVPCMSIMNMPPLAYLARISSVDVAGLRGCYTDPTVWDAFDPALMTLCSPDPQAFRPPDEKVNVLQVSLPTNFKAARFASDANTAMLNDLARDIEASRLETPRGPVELPVKLKVHESIFVPLAKWSMLLTGNYRCVQPDGMRSIRDAVHADPRASREVYEWVARLCKALGAADADLVPFEKYASAAQGLVKPSSAARALAAGARNIERVDRLVQTIGAQKGMRLPAVDELVARVDAWLARNRRAAAGEPARVA
ncbi:MAG TPA: hypothetical protein VLG08_11185 [Casimicrobiaceae bacterium]|nr:hypothetical protein [Casimicrobiaceae bacterium]